MLKNYATGIVISQRYPLVNLICIQKINYQDIEAIKEIAEDLSISQRKTSDYLSELEQFGLIEKKQRGQGKPSILYVKNFVYENV